MIGTTYTIDIPRRQQLSNWLVLRLIFLTCDARSPPCNWTWLGLANSWEFLFKFHKTQSKNKNSLTACHVLFLLLLLLYCCWISSKQKGALLLLFDYLMLIKSSDSDFRFQLKWYDVWTYLLGIRSGSVTNSNQETR